jgi:hypothetical protein
MVLSLCLSFWYNRFRRRLTMKTLVAVADRGRFKAFRLVRAKRDSRAHLDPLESPRQEEVQNRLSELLAESAGRLPRVGVPSDIGATGMPVGGRHKIELELRRRAMQTVAAGINGLLADDAFDACWLAAAQPISRELLDDLRADVRAKISRVLPRDLTKIGPDEVLRHFEAISGRSGPGVSSKTVSLRLKAA